jgi:NAD(P)-dependent dehydrogenase (short-subunit alcohol dehydrogenase family)
MEQRSAVVVGVGHAAGVGAAVARRFAREGHLVTVLGRNAQKLEAAKSSFQGLAGEVRVVVGDVTDGDLLARVVADADRPEVPLDLAVFNAGGNWPRPYLEMDRGFLEEMWRVNALAGFEFSRAAVRAMLPRERGTLIFTGATASLRGRANFGGFASAKAALRALAQSCAREFGPKGLHVAHVVIDGAVDGDRVNSLLPDLRARRGADGMLHPDAIAANYWHLHQQSRSAWTHELDLRPWSESW